MDKKQTVAVDYERLKDIDYDVKEMALNIAASIDIIDKTRGLHSQYTNKDRVMAVAIYVVVGTYRGASRICGISAKTLCAWGHSDWWADAITQSRTINTSILNARTTKIINQTFDNIDQRLTLGDAYVDKNQRLKYKPVSAKDNAIVFGVMFDKQRINNSLATHISQANVSHLIDIKHQFDTMTGTRVIEGDRVTSD